jgi:benzoyl-CoA reductase/2-hydroxyglutaryl-CoA dehydratase subunit BcrC/BadD/HgdB
VNPADERRTPGESESAEVNDRRELRLKKTAARAEAESRALAGRLEARSDRPTGYDYFLNLALACSPEEAARRAGRPVLRLLCVQAPLELIHAAGFQPFRVFSGSPAEAAAAPPGLPALMCPLLRAALGSARPGETGGPLVLPTTCDWVVKWPAAFKLTGRDLSSLQWLELPHLKEKADSRKRWLDEIWNLKNFLEDLSGRALSRRALLASVKVYGRAWTAREKLKAARREGRLAGVWFLLIMNTFFMDKAEKWTERLEELLKALPTGPAVAAGRVFLAGSPIFFPNFKLPLLMEEAGLTVAADDLCSSEMVFPGGVDVSDPSLFGLTAALAGRYHQSCLCPTFADNDRRVNNILGQRAEAAVEGVVFQVLKGCHPYDLESWALEAPLKRQGLKFLRLETDYSTEDSQNLLTRLEAYRRTLGED